MQACNFCGDISPCYKTICDIAKQRDALSAENAKLKRALENSELVSDARNFYRLCWEESAGDQAYRLMQKIGAREALYRLTNYGDIALSNSRLAADRDEWKACTKRVMAELDTARKRVQELNAENTALRKKQENNRLACAGCREMADRRVSSVEKEIERVTTERDTARTNHEALRQEVTKAFEAVKRCLT